MKEYDVIIAGAGPAGLSVAGELSKDRKIRILLIEKRKKLRSNKPWTCWASELEQFDLKSIIANKSKKIVYRTYLGTTAEKNSDYCVVDQNKFFKEMFLRINKENFDFLAGCKFISYNYSSEGGIIIRTSKGRFKSKILVDATGLSSPVLKRNNIKNSKDYYYIYSKIMETDYINPSKMVLLDVLFRDKYKVWFWLIPFSSKKFIIASYYFTKDHIPLKHASNNLKRYLKLHKIKAKTLETRVGVIHPCDFQKTYFGNILLVGESANQAVPANAYLFVKSLMFGKIAAKTAIEALYENNFSESFLKRYENKWKKKVGLSYTFEQMLGKIIYSFNDEDVDYSFMILDKVPDETVKRFETGDLTRKDILLISYYMIRYFKLGFLLGKFNQHKSFYLKRFLKLMYLFFNPSI